MSDYSSTQTTHQTLKDGLELYELQDLNIRHSRCLNINNASLLSGERLLVKQHQNENTLRIKKTLHEPRRTAGGHYSDAPVQM